MGGSDGVGIRELAGLLFLYKLAIFLQWKDVGLYKNDDMAVVENVRKKKKMKKYITNHSKPRGY